MTQEEIKKIEEYFTCYSETEMYDYMWERGLQVRWFFHKEEDYFKLAIFTENNTVYQGGTEANTIGVELETFEELMVRFESFTREKIDNITQRIYQDEGYKS